MNHQNGGKMSMVTREKTYGIDEKLYTSTPERKKLKEKFEKFINKAE